MNPHPEYDKLLNDYRELQLRVTRFSSVEQQLINTRDKLDHELELHKRLHAFNSKALHEQSNESFIQLICEAIIDIFEVEHSYVLLEEKESKDKYHLKTEGLPNSPDPTQLLTALRQLGIAQVFNQTHYITGTELNKHLLNATYKEGLVFTYSDPNESYHLLLIGANTTQKAALYPALHARHETLFAIFVQQLQSLLENRRKSSKINEQIKIISASERELKKLSMIATKTKNGVIISDNQGYIEWVNESFEKCSGYKLEEIKGKKPKDFLQRKDFDIEPKEKLSKALKNLENVEVTITNYNKNNQPFYNQLEITPVFDDDGNLINFIALQKDITSEIQFQRDILRINTRFELITGKSMIGIWEWQPQRNVLIWNDIMLQQYGLKPDQDPRKLYDVWKSHIHPEDKEKIVHDVNALIEANGEMLEQEFRIVRADGSIRILKCLVINEKSDDYMRVIGTSIDVTDQRLAEFKLKSSEEKYRGIIENMNLGLVEINTSGDVVFSNRQFHELTLLDDASALSITQNAEYFLKKRMEEGIILNYRKIDQSVFEIEYRRRDLSLVYLLVSTAPVYNQQEQITGHISIFLDITAVKTLQKNLEEALRERDEFIHKVNSLRMFYENILNHSPAEILVTDEKLNLTYANTRLLAKENNIEDHLGKSIFDIPLSNVDARERWNNIIRNIQESAQSNTLMQFEETRTTKQSAEPSVILRSILPHYNEKNELKYTVVSGIDISDLKKVQQDVVKKNDELKKINAELDNFVYSISHDLRSPLLSIKGILALILEKAQLNDQIRNYMHLAETSATRLDHTIQEILDYSRNTRLELKLSHVNIVTLTEHIFDDLRFSTSEPVVMTCHIEGSAEWLTDEYRLNTLLKNIIGNAVKYRRKDNDGARVDVTITHTNQQLTIVVSDNGEGIEEKDIDRIFEMFYRATTSVVGTGLGLYICREILVKLHGTIHVQSVKGSGTTMTIQLPQLITLSA